MTKTMRIAARLLNERIIIRCVTSFAIFIYTEEKGEKETVDRITHAFVGIRDVGLKEYTG